MTSRANRRRVRNLLRFPMAVIEGIAFALIEGLQALSVHLMRKKRRRIS